MVVMVGNYHRYPPCLLLLYSKFQGIIARFLKKHRGKNGFRMMETKTWCGKLDAGREEGRKGLES
jgi:hypothetical protein